MWFSSVQLEVCTPCCNLVYISLPYSVKIEHVLSSLCLWRPSGRPVFLSGKHSMYNMSSSLVLNFARSTLIINCKITWQSELKSRWLKWVSSYVILSFYCIYSAHWNAWQNFTHKHVPWIFNLLRLFSYMVRTLLWDYTQTHVHTPATKQYIFFLNVSIFPLE